MAIVHQDFFHNEDDHCVPEGDCPKGFSQHDETGTCHPESTNIKCTQGFGEKQESCFKNVVIHVDEVHNHHSGDTIKVTQTVNNIAIAVNCGTPGLYPLADFHFFPQGNFLPF